MDKKRAKEIVELYFEHNLLTDVKIMGEDHIREVCNCSLYELKEAHWKLLEELN